jgi:hypothetical protein
MTKLFFSILIVLTNIGTFTKSSELQTKCLLVQKEFKIEQVVYKDIAGAMKNYVQNDTHFFNIFIGVFYSTYESEQFDYILNVELDSIVNISFYKGDSIKTFKGDSIFKNLLYSSLIDFPKGDYQQIKQNSISGRTIVFFLKEENNIIYKHLFESGSDYECLNLNDEHKKFNNASVIFTAIHDYLNLPNPK